MKRLYKNNYLDGIFEFGTNEIIVNEEGYKIEKFFNVIGTSFYKLDYLKESDFLKFDTSKIEISMKVRIMSHRDIKANHVIFMNNEYFKIEHIEPKTKGTELVLYLSQYVDTLDKEISILEYKDSFAGEQEKLLIKILAKVEFKEITFENLAEKQKNKVKCTVIIQDLDIIKSYQKSGRIGDLVICFEDYRLSISHINIKSHESGLYSILCEGV